MNSSPVGLNVSSQQQRFYWRASLFIVAVYVAAFGVFTIGRYERYNSTGFDLAFYDQILWRTAHGDIMGVSIEGDNVSNWAFHVEPILLLIAPFTLIFSDTRWLLILQTVALAVAALAVYRIATRHWQKPWAGFAFAALYLLYPVVGWSNKFDLHPLTLTTPLLFFAFDAAELKHWRLTSALLLLALLCKEEMGFVVACFGLYWFFSEAHWRPGLAWAAIGIVYALVGFFVIIPGAQGKSLSLLPNQAFLRYAWLFSGTLQQKMAYITGPDTPVKIRFLIQLFTPLLFTPLLKPRILLVASPVIALSLLSTNLNQSGIYHQYMTDVVPFLFIAAIKGSYDIRPLLQRLGLRLRLFSAQRVLLIGMFASTALMFVLLNPFNFVPREPYAPIYGWESGASLDGLRAAESLIPADSCLTATNNIASHFGQRKYIYVFGVGHWSDCDLSMVDFADTRFSYVGVAQELRIPQQFMCEQFALAGYHPIFVEDNVVITKKGAPPDANRDAQLAQLCAKVTGNS